MPWKAPRAADEAAPRKALLLKMPWENSSWACWKLAPVRRYRECTCGRGRGERSLLPAHGEPNQAQPPPPTHPLQQEQGKHGTECEEASHHHHDDGHSQRFLLQRRQGCDPTTAWARGRGALGADHTQATLPLSLPVPTGASGSRVFMSCPLTDPQLGPRGDSLPGPRPVKFPPRAFHWLISRQLWSWQRGPHV